MQIAIVTSEFGYNAGGLSFACLSFAQLLEKIGYEVIIISSTYSSNDNYPVSNKFQIIRNKLSISDGGYKTELKEHLFFRAHIKNVVCEIRNQKFKYIIAFGAGYNGLFASEISNFLNIKLIVLLRGSEINLTISDYELNSFNLQCLKRATKVIALSKELLERSKEIHFSANIQYVVIPNYIKSFHYSKDSVILKNTITLGCGSKNLNEKKGVANLITMLKYLNQKSDNRFRFEFSGKVDDDLLLNYMDLCKLLNVEGYVKFLGDLNREDFILKMKAWDFYVQGSFCEGFSNSVAEYLSLGKKIILSDSGFIAETVKKSSNEIVFNNHIPEDMALKILSLVNNEQIHYIYEKAFKDIFEVANYEYVKNKWRKTLNYSYLPNLNNKRIVTNILSVILHDIGNDNHSNIETPLNVLESFVNDINKKGFKLCSVKDYFNSENKSNLIICTFDDGYTGVKEYGLPILKEFGFTATVFVCYDYIGKTNYWNLKDKKNRNHMNAFDLQTLQKEGWEIGSHGLSHRSILKLSDDDLKIELSLSKQLLELEFGEIRSYAYPYGDYNEYCKSQTASFYKTAFALTRGGTLNGIDNYQIRRYFISEILKQI